MHNLKSLKLNLNLFYISNNVSFQVMYDIRNHLIYLSLRTDHEDMDKYRKYFTDNEANLVWIRNQDRCTHWNV